MIALRLEVDRVGLVIPNRFAANGHETAIAIGGVLAFVLYVFFAVFHEDQSGTAGTVVQEFPLLIRWCCFASLGAGGALVLWGLGRPRLAMEVAGLVIMSGGLGIYIVAVGSFLGLRHLAAGGPLLAALIIANLLRARSLTRNRDVITITDGDEEIRMARHGG